MELLWWCTFAIVSIRLTQTADQSTKDIKGHPAWSILDTFECGESAADRIIGGTNAALGQLPWIVRLGYTGAFGDIDWLCGGALLSDRHVITAAHCVLSDDLYNLTHVRLGENDINKDPDCQMSVCAPPVQDVRVKSSVSHERFNIPVFHNDLAIIELAEPAVLNDYVAPICLPRNAEQMSPLAKGDSVVVAGWGKTNMTTEEKADILQLVYLPVLDPKNCSVFNNRFTWTNGAICAGGEKNKDACAGDSGGPLTRVFDTTEGPKHVLVGVVSFGPAICGTGNLPGIYVSVPYFLKWILEHIDGSYTATRNTNTNDKNALLDTNLLINDSPMVKNNTMPSDNQQSRDTTPKQLNKTKEASIDIVSEQDNSNKYSPKDISRSGENVKTNEGYCQVPKLQENPTANVDEENKNLKTLNFNAESAPKEPDAARSRDENIEVSQSKLTEAIAAMSKAMTALVSDTNNLEVIQLLSNVCNILYETQIGQTRKKQRLIMPSINVIRNDEKDKFANGKRSENTEVKTPIGKQELQIDQNVLSRAATLQQINLLRGQNWTNRRYFSPVRGAREGMYTESRSAWSPIYRAN